MARQGAFTNVCMWIAIGTLLVQSKNTNSKTSHDSSSMEKSPNTDPAVTYPRLLSLAKADDYILEWSYGEEDITFRVTVKTTGWIGLGFSPSGGMKGADVVIGWVDKGKSYLSDLFAFGNEQPVLDKQQDYKLVHGKEDSGRTTLTFTRKLNTGDCHDITLALATTRLIWSYHSEDPCSTTGPAYHGVEHRGTRSVILLAEDHSQIENLPEDTKMHEFLNDNYEGIIAPGNEGYVHHMILHACYEAPPDEKLYSFSDMCVKLPKEIQDCFSMVFYWTIGGGPFVFPAHVGYAIGPNDPLYLRLEVHYDNPLLPEDFTDTSGFRFYYTPTLRQNSGGLLPIGVFPNWWYIIPPRQKEFSATGWCLANCSNLYFPKDGIKVFSAIPHTHQSGQKLMFRHFRNGRLVATIIDEKYYDANFQEIRPLKQEVIFMPGDVLHTECVLNTSDRETLTYGGYGRMDEMCLTTIFYYPKIDNFGDCLSVAQPVDVLKRLGYKEASSLPVEIDQATTIRAFESFDWTDSNFILEFKKAISEANLYFRCDNQTRLEQMDPFDEWKIPEVDYPATDNKKCV